MTKPTRQISYLPISDLKPDPRNPKSHALDVIDDSIGRFGYVEPIVLDERTGFIVSGHGRTKTLQQMAERGETPPEGLQIDADGNWLAPVVTGWASRSDSEAAAALIALNRTTELGGWVDDALLNILEELTEVDDEHGLEGVGFTDADLEILTRSLKAAEGITDVHQIWEESGVTSPPPEEDEWVRRVIVRFLTEEDYETFKEKLGLSEKANNSFWYPERGIVEVKGWSIEAVEE